MIVSTKKIISLSFFVLACNAIVFGMQPQWRAIFAHGQGSDATQGAYYQDFIGCEIIGGNGPELNPNWDKAIPGAHPGDQSCLAQDDDIEVVVNQLNQQPQNNNHILLGVSKGAATMINTVGWLADNTPNQLNSINAVILDSPFASPESVGAYRVGLQTKNLVPTSIEWLASAIALPYILPNYNPRGITPIKSITRQWHNVNRDMVVVFIHSREDISISYNDSRLLYCELKKLGFNNLYLIETPRGAHANIFWGADQAMIMRSLGLIYLRHQLPMPNFDFADEVGTRINIASLEQLHADRGEELLTALQPPVHEIAPPSMNFVQKALITGTIVAGCGATYDLYLRKNRDESWIRKYSFKPKSASEENNADEITLEDLATGA